MNEASIESPSIEGQVAWVFSDGKAGHEAQCLGVVEALGVIPVMKQVQLSGIYKLIAPWGPLPAGEADRFVGGPPWPAFAFATGRTTIPYMRALRARAKLQTFTVILMDPKTGPNSADLIWVPEHDRRRGPNVITTLTAPHRFSAARIAAQRATVPPEIAALQEPRIACLIGGPNGDYTFSDADEDRLVAALRSIAGSGAGLMITTSRRTPDRLAARLREVLGVGSRALIWTGEGPNPYPDFLAHADAFVITADSVSMTCEAAATGRPIHVFMPSGGSAKFTRFHSALQAYGATRPLGDQGQALACWSYPPINSAEEIAAEIRSRWLKRVKLVPGLMNPARA